ncbi:tRNA (N6-isopentenyl adenosine(37)-C2)-methylthiotransferase MiaB [Aliarcobacter cryaerophilus]|jgi:tRNA-2-methylthio-N6-dimethylallyladenosine synthase|uniref:tRNA-2-methylthio-N(6)-dimethylallyladenosine synthase n=2 Tax=unclassified Arcobacter TaxID=2593671 RepID=A0AA96D1G5_9BACT|nr:tRNA (N6-isopentenyl adenosine(37)-C2)-methylthiotransferase MiaB [Aliarcobacter cryaerophilus]WNL12667.1 tRNA (N6-isopentenyl adenosine(37)-C2)-methylthiotransferase MiaB [Arcobacter sp. AZ-2023]WPD09152.1 tRNA (N6-isopentenyl adenosine(37)-C2)-methylthiotransferase MiaB [Arcobacter sp. DSM 115954]MCT7461783.1 tRNA (N6-isopentenyl adenosine(37)-C2)-methylthiotransferase MiaB [Aliarcobacter cryaerophilus]MCT7486695.1 tRNA (N6-isopentenyl adenosine(37)-C2)-methylthiotransferase MiaB [Aliarcob
MSKKLFIQTLGCQMNDTDSKHIQAELEKHKGYSATQNIEDADLIIINTCSVREKPVQKLFSEIGQFNKKKKDGAKIGVCGCTASHLGEDIIKRAPYVDFVLGARNISKIKDVVDKKGSVEISIDNDDSQYEFAIANNNNFRTSVNISVGCDKECTYCIVPSTRGDEISIPPEMIVSQIQKAVDNGVVEVALLGQNVNSYGKRFSNNRDKYSFTQLLQDISKIDGLKRIRFTSPHPLHMDDEFIEEFARNPKISKCIHMPLQSGSTKILKAMKRGYTKEWFLNRALKMRELIPDLRITTDIIVAFPGETHEDFLDTLDVVNQVKFDQIFNFKYSPRPNTKALELKDLEIEDSIGSARLDELIELHKRYLENSMPNMIGKTVNVLVESLKPNGEVSGYTDNYFLVFTKGSDELLGKFVNVKITSATRTSLKGEIVE